MEKRNRKAGSRYSLRDRILAQIMIVLITVTMLPYESLVVHAASTTTVKSIGGIETEYEVEYGTSKDDIGLPSSLSVTIETATSAEGATEETAPAVSEETVDKSVSWKGNYDGNTAGDYALTAEFDDSSLSYSKMPTVHVTVREKETTSEGASNEAGKTEDAEDGDDDGESDQPAQSEEEPAVEEPAAEEPAAEEPAKQEKADEEEEEIAEEVEAASKDALKYTPTGREESSLNAFGQADMDTLYYDMPEGIICLATHTGESEVHLLTSDDEQLTLVSTFTVDKSKDPNQIIYPWNKEEDEDNTYERVAAAENVRIKIRTRMAVNPNGGGVTFEDGTELPVDLTVGITVIKENQVNGSYVLTAADKEKMVFAIFEGDGSTNVRAKDKDGVIIPEFTFADMADAFAAIPTETEPPPAVVNVAPFMPASEGAVHLPPCTS